MIKIGKHWELTNDLHSWILVQCGMKQVLTNRKPTGEKKWGQIQKTYYANLSGVFRHIVDQDAKQATTLEGIIGSIRDSINVINDAMCADTLKDSVFAASERLEGKIV